MSDEEETIEVDGDHPWVQAAATMHPTPVPTSVGLFPSEVPLDEGKMAQAAMLQVMTPSGVTSVYMPPGMVINLFQQCQAILEFWERESAKSPRLVVADANMEREAKNHADSLLEAAKKMRGV